MSTQLKSGAYRRIAPLAMLALAILSITAWWILRGPPSTSSTPPMEEPLFVAEGEAGKVGDLTVTQEAMDLAEIQVAAANARLVAETIPVSGTLQAGGDQLIKITPPAPGKVIRLLAGQGDSVRAGQTLAVISSRDLAEAQAAYSTAMAKLSAARSDLGRQRELARLGQFGRPQVEDARSRSAEANRELHAALRDLTQERTALAEALSDIKRLVSKTGQAKTELEVLRLQLEREESLFQQGFLARQDLERTRANYAKAQADVDVAEAERAQGEARAEGAKQRIAASESALEQVKKSADIAKAALSREEKVYQGQFLTSRETVAAESLLRQAEVEVRGAGDQVRILGGSPGGGSEIPLKSPINGRVQERSATLGETIDPEHPAFTVVNLERVWAQLAVSPSDLSSVQVGDTVELKVESGAHQVFTGRVMSVGSAADETTRAVSVRTTLENPGDVLRPGMFVTGTVVTDVRKERLTVPEDALQEHSGRPTVYVAIDNKPGSFEVRHVLLGVGRDGWREVVAGLVPGEKIAVSGTFYLKSEALKSQLSDGCCAPAGG